MINASAAGVFLEALEQESVTRVLGAAHGIKGILGEEFFDISLEDPRELELLKHTPSSALGSVRRKLKPFEEDESEYERLLESFRKYDVRHFIYNGGNDSMDTCCKIDRYLRKVGYECNVIGVPKTIDNDLCLTDHCPGYGSAAKYVATTLMEIFLDATVYDKGQIAIVEIMGRNAGWLTAASALAACKGYGPDLVYLPEQPFDIERFVDRVKSVCASNGGKCIVAVSEGIKTSDGRYAAEALTARNASRDSFGHAQLGGAASALAGLAGERIGGKIRAIEFSLMQRCAAHLASKTDIDEAFEAGRAAVRASCAGETGKMVTFERKDTDEYEIEYGLTDLSRVANAEKKVPAEWILPDNRGMSAEYVKYALPLIAGECEAPTEDGLPRFAELRKIRAK